jgi:hypothetical protein
MNEYVIWIQKSLKLLGYEPGPVDGIDGRLTRAAVCRYQQEGGLTVDGLVGAQTHGALMTDLKNLLLLPDSGDQIAGSLVLKDFTADEFKCPCGCGLDVVKPMKIFAQQIRDQFGWPLTISSGGRCPAVNREVGGVSDSLHLSGQAFDCYFAGHMTEDLLAQMAAFAVARGIGVIRYPGQLFCHFQTFPRNTISN